MLYLIATPIGNLKDLTYRAVEVLSQCDYILCEDTRHSKILLTAYNIQKPLRSYHKFNERETEDRIISDLKAGKDIALISDAGTPGISDPGEALVARCRTEEIPLTSLPGPCAWITALTLAPFDKTRVQFLGFLPQKQKEFKKMAAQILSFPGTTTFYEAPHRIEKTIHSLAALDPSRRIALARELTKKFEEYLEDEAFLLAQKLHKKPIKGEIVVIVSPAAEKKQAPLKEHVLAIQKQFQLSLAEAIDVVAELEGISKRELYYLRRD